VENGQVEVAGTWSEAGGSGTRTITSGGTTTTTPVDMSGYPFDATVLASDWVAPVDFTAIHYFADGVEFQEPTPYTLYTDTLAARTTLKLYTGGKSQVSRQHLFGLYVDAAYEYQPAPADASVGDPWANASIIGIPRATLQIQGQQVGADGNLWTTLPDNESPEVTVTVPGKKHYDAGVTPAKYPLTIMANGNDLSSTNPTFCVGQYITFTLSGLPTGSIANMIGQWVLPQKYVNEPWQNQQWVVTDPTSGSGYWSPYGSQNYRLDSSLLQNTNQTSCWYVNGQGGQVSVGLGLTFNNGQYAIVTANGKFSIYRPKASMQFIHEPRYFTISDDIGLTCNLKLGANDGSGLGDMYYTVEVDSTPITPSPSGDATNPHFYGDAGITQLITADYSNPLYVIPDPELDGPEFYFTLSRVTGSGVLGLDDGPFDIWTTPNIVSITATDYVRFKPDGSNSIYVTLGIVTWDAVGIAEQDFWGNWTITTDESPDPSGPDNSDTFPVWTKIVGL